MTCKNQSCKNKNSFGECRLTECEAMPKKKAKPASKCKYLYKDEKTCVLGGECWGKGCAGWGCGAQSRCAILQSWKRQVE